MLHFHSSIVSFYLPEVPRAGNGSGEMKRFDAQKSLEAKRNEKEIILKTSQEGTWKILQEYIKQNPERAKRYETLSKSLTEAEWKKDMWEIGKLRAQKLQFEQYALIEWGILQNENMKKDVKEVLKNRNGYDSLKPSDVLLLRKKWVDIAPLLLYDPSRPDASITSDSLKAWQTLTVNFWWSKSIDETIGIGDIFPSRIRSIEITDLHNQKTIWSWKPLPRPWYYTDTDKYIRIFDWYTIRIINDSQVLSEVQKRLLQTSQDTWLAERRIFDMLNSGILNEPKNKRWNKIAELFTWLTEDQQIFNEIQKIRYTGDKNPLAQKNTSEVLWSFQSESIKIAKELEQTHGVPWQVTYAQSALESRWWQSAPWNNYFWIKWKWQLQKTKEYYWGWTAQQASFRTYASMRESFEDYANLLQKKWPQAFNTRDPVEFTRALVSWPRKYATDPEYVDKVRRIISTIPTQYLA